MSTGQQVWCAFCARNPINRAFRSPDPDRPGGYSYFCSNEHRRWWERVNKIHEKKFSGGEVTEEELEFLRRHSW